VDFHIHAQACLAGSALRGEKFGELDHIAWVTLKNEGPPKIINSKLEGMIGDDVVNEEILPISSTLIDRVR